MRLRDTARRAADARRSSGAASRSAPPAVSSAMRSRADRRRPPTSTTRSRSSGRARCGSRSSSAWGPRPPASCASGWARRAPGSTSDRGRRDRRRARDLRSDGTRLRRSPRARPRRSCSCSRSSSSPAWPTAGRDRAAACSPPSLGPVAEIDHRRARARALRGVGRLAVRRAVVGSALSLAFGIVDARLAELLVAGEPPRRGCRREPGRACRDRPATALPIRVTSSSSVISTVSSPPSSLTVIGLAARAGMRRPRLRSRRFRRRASPPPRARRSAPGPSSLDAREGDVGALRELAARLDRRADRLRGRAPRARRRPRSRIAGCRRRRAGSAHRARAS